MGYSVFHGDLLCSDDDLYKAESVIKSDGTPCSNAAIFIASQCLVFGGFVPISLELVHEKKIELKDL